MSVEAMRATHLLGAWVTSAQRAKRRRAIKARPASDHNSRLEAPVGPAPHPHPQPPPSPSPSQASPVPSLSESAWSGLATCGQLSRAGAVTSRARAARKADATGETREPREERRTRAVLWKYGAPTVVSGLSAGQRHKRPRLRTCCCPSSALLEVLQLGRAPRRTGAHSCRLSNRVSRLVAGA